MTEGRPQPLHSQDLLGERCKTSYACAYSKENRG